MKNTINLFVKYIVFTLLFNVISFVLFFSLFFGFHFDSNISWLVFACAQFLLTILVFQQCFNIYGKVYENKHIFISLSAYFILMTVLSFIMIPLRNDGWYSLIFTNTFHVFCFNSLFDINKGYVIAYVTENIIKTICLYLSSRNLKMNKILTIVLSIVTTMLFFVFLGICFVAHI